MIPSRDAGYQVLGGVFIASLMHISAYIASTNWAMPCLADQDQFASKLESSGSHAEHRDASD